MKFSIRLRLMWTLLLAIFALSIGASIAAYMQARAEVNTLFDYEIQQMTLTLSMHISAHPKLTEEPLLRVEHDFVTQVWGRQHQLLLSSHPGRGPNRVMPEGFSNFGDSDKGWRTFTAIAGDYVLQVAQPQSLRRRMAADIALKAMVPVLAIIPIGGLIIWLVVGYGLKPLRVIAREVEARDPGSLRLIEATKLPSEVAPLVTSLNDLFGRLDQALKFEREFIADASHELRTPVTALSLQVGLLETASTAKERDESIQDLKHGVERMRRLIEQILTLARLDPDNSENTGLIDITLFIREMHEDYARVAAAKSINFKVSTEDQVTVRGDLASLTALIRNLLDNAVRYTPLGGVVTIQVDTHQRAAPQIQISDSGPGIPAEIREKVFSRFFRADHASDNTGTGLGLAIAKRAAERLGASLQLEDVPGGTGLTVLIRFPIPADPAQTPRAKSVVT